MSDTGRTTEEIYRHLREFRDELETRPGFGWAEISNGQLIMMMSPSPRHDLVALDIAEQLRPQLSPGVVAATSGDVADEHKGKLRRPDVLVLPRAAFDTDDDAIDPRELLAAIEVVSPSNPENDYQGKLRDYPVMGIPHYLIVDPRNGTCVHYWAITDEGGTARYDARVPYVFGDRIHLGEWTIDTATLIRYRPADFA